MTTIRSFTELKVWQRAMDLVVDTYRITATYPRAELFVLSSHSRRTAISIASNIAEGACRSSTATFIHHLNVALGSEAELFTQIECARRLGFVADRPAAQYFADLSELGRMLRGLVKSLESNRDKVR